MATQTFEGVGPSLEDAVRVAHDKIPPRAGRDFTVSKVVTWGMQFGGFAEQRSYYVVLEEDPDTPFRT